MEDKLKAEILALLQETQFQDSIEIGDSKGRIKVYVNFANEEQASEKVSAAIRVLKNEKQEEQQL